MATMKTRRLALYLSSLLCLGALSPALAAGGSASKASGPYLSLTPFVVNVAEGRRMRFMQVETQVMVRDSGLRSVIEHNMPAVRDAFILLLADQSVEAMRTIEGREKLRHEALAMLQAVLGQFTRYAAGVEAIYFTDFVIQ